MIIEAAWGLGEAVVSGAVSPDNYVVSREDRSVDVTVAEKKVMHVKDAETGETVERAVPEDRRDERVVTDAEIDALVDLGERVEDHYDEPQDVEWAIVDGEVFMLQSRPITTIDETDRADAATDSLEETADPITGVTDGSGSVQSAQEATRRAPTAARSSSTDSVRAPASSAGRRRSSPNSTIWPK